LASALLTGMSHRVDIRYCLGLKMDGYDIVGTCNEVACE
jgi:hypothetical protein